MGKIRYRILCMCVARSGAHGIGRIFSWIASVLTDGYKNRAWIATLHPSGYIAHTACITHKDLRLGRRVYVGDRVTIYGTTSGGSIELSDDVRIYGDVVIETDAGGSITIGEGTHIQPRCQFGGSVAPITIGKRCEIAPACAFYSFNHAFDGDVPIRQQGLRSRGPLVIQDDVWVGYGAVVLAGVTVGRGAVIGANSVVTHDVPPFAIAAGNPARVLRYRRRHTEP